MEERSIPTQLLQLHANVQPIYVKGPTMNKLVVALSCLLFSSVTYAANSGCEAQAVEKKLAGAAKNSFLKKCEKDAAAAATATCEAQAADKKLAGAAKNSFVKKCAKDAAAAN
jgi:hypothetical protein